MTDIRNIAGAREAIFQRSYKRRSKIVPLTGLLGSVHFGVKVYRS